MGYPMTYKRVINRNRLDGDYNSTSANLLQGDLRRLEKDSVDGGPVPSAVAEKTGLSVEQVQSVITAWMEIP